MSQTNAHSRSPFLIAFGIGISISAQAWAAGVVTGKMNLWYPVTITWDGPAGDENASTFRNNRLDVTFTNGAKTFKVPGYFAADGNAAETGATAGNKWRVKFSPNTPGTWTYTAAFRTGTDVAASMDPAAGTPVALDGNTGTFVVLPKDPAAPGFYAKGHIRYVGGSYPQFEGSKEWFVKGGSGSPENFLAYKDFDGTKDMGNMSPNTPSRLHEWPTHVAEWKAGDPSWQNGKGKAIIGAINYLASKGVNTQYIVANSVKGDGQDNWPWTSYEARDIYDVSKLDQWDIVFTHMNAKGINIHYLLWEAENTRLLNNGDMGPERMIYDREIIARFSHCPGIAWDFAEEPTTSHAQTAKGVEHLYQLDPYQHLTGSHCMVNTTDLYTANYGKPGFHAAFMQTQNFTGPAAVVKGSKSSGQTMVVSIDEGKAVGVGGAGASTVHEGFWSVMMLGGYGHEAYFGYGGNVGDCDDDNFHARDAVWTMYGTGLKFFSDYRVNHFLGLGSGMVPGTGVLANESNPADAAYIVYPATATLNVTKATGPLEVWWFNTNSGTELVQGAVKTVTGGGTVNLGAAPGTGTWAVLVANHVNPPDVSVGIYKGSMAHSQANLVAFSIPQAGLAVNYALTEPATVTLEAFSAAGRKTTTLLENSRQGSGSHSLSFPGFDSRNANIWVRLRIASGSGTREFSTRVLR